VLVRERDENKTVADALAPCSIIVASEEKQDEKKTVDLRWTVQQWLGDTTPWYDVWFERKRLTRDTTLISCGVRANSRVTFIRRPAEMKCDLDVTVLVKERRGMRLYVMAKMSRLSTPRYILSTLMAMGESPSSVFWLYHNGTRLDKHLDHSLDAMGLAASDALTLEADKK
jgi:hypothetical protein